MSKKEKKIKELKENIAHWRKVLGGKDISENRYMVVPSQKPYLSIDEERVLRNAIDNAKHKIAQLEKN